MSKKSVIILAAVIFGVLFLYLGLRGEESQDTGLAFLDTLQQPASFDAGRVDEQEIVRQPAVAGTFYPKEPEELKETIDDFLEKAERPDAAITVSALILPHAGYRFSGQVASYGIKALAGKQIDTVVIIGNSHNERFEGVSVFPKGYYKTPLGEVEIDSGLASALIGQHERIFFKETAHQSEHSIEVELPLLQQTLQGFKIVPILFGNSGEEDYKILAEALLQALTESSRNVLLLASSDLSHYPVYEKANYADEKTLEAILTGKVEELEKAVEGLEKEGIAEAVTFACGIDAIKTVMQVANDLGADEIKLLKHANSGDVSAGDRSRVVGYAAVGFFGHSFDETLRAPDSVEEESLLDKEQQEKLLEIARTTVESVIKKGKIPSFELDEAALNQKLGAFVTLKKHGQLRGCIGSFSPTNQPLYQTVSAMAAAAATQDKRFSPVREDELPLLHYEVSVLSALKKIDDWREIELGKHGVQLNRGRRSGVFLPQVATENNWDIDRFMGELCQQKAGLEWDCWEKDTVDLFVFTAQVFEEEL